jgi:hypothetical protein
MIKLFDRNSTKLTISEFFDNFEQGKYNFKVEYQRKSDVWSEDKRSFLIDSILKNYPMPPIFMRPNIDTQSGKTKYDIVDGKQRLESIIGFIKNNVLLTTYFSEDDIFVDGAGEAERDICGKSFAEMKESPMFAEYVKQFWTYSINIDYLYEEDINLVSNIFDRLNRNGEPLTRQELRNAKYHSSHLLSIIKELAQNEYWKERFGRLKIERMEDEEFISELFFLTAEDAFFDSTPQALDDLYEKFAPKDTAELQTITDIFLVNTRFLTALAFDYDDLKKLNWTTHLYGLYSMAWHCTRNQIKPEQVKASLLNLYTEYFKKISSEYSDAMSSYKNSCSSRTRSKGQREKRLNAIIEYCEVS